MRKEMNPDTNNAPQKTYDKTKKIQTIKSVTRQLIETQGYDATTNHGIASKAELSVGLLYKYFPRGKIDIIHALIEDEELSLSKYYNNFPLDAFSTTNYKILLKQLLTTFYQSHLAKQKYIQSLEIAMLSHPEIFKEIRGTAQELLTLVNLMEKLWALGLLEQKWERNDIILRTMMIDQLIHQHIFFHISSFPTDDEFLEFTFGIILQLFRIK
jgi:AcrR family transcriptional regulator